MNLDRFVTAQEPVLEAVRAELAAGRKRTHWMWFVFPQLAGLGTSAMAQRYAIASLDEARAYLAHPVLGPRLKECAQLLLAQPDDDIHRVMGSPDDMKFRSCMTLFQAAAPQEAVFAQCLARFYQGQPDARTLALL
ncbi:MAG: DUF1810 domain-containing protein [Burkholderiales bacterium]|nr:DUF1810 domain-containing protein [Burkholderiales bacterium]